MYEIKIEKFQGPLDLLLQLIEQEELDITEVSLAQVTDQYLEYLKQVEELNPEEVADFLVVAAKLLLIKSRLLLPTLDLGGEEEASELERQLRLYQRFIAAGRAIDKLWRAGHVAWVRPKPLILKREEPEGPPPNLSVDGLRQALGRVIAALEPIIKLPQVTLLKVISITEKIQALKAMILKKAHLNWQSLIKGAKDKTEIIVSFLALLELVKQRQLIAEQSALFQDINLTRLEN
ncbi:MAG: ScpA family protein [Candidatus Veblenbacteria bacterium]|nr:ScpA family protein [Candidatus Veblenbacteria bacterium]MDZ4229771.1 ScpA family protein [Candidatus Veblenbacteria bacterium]